MKTRAGRKRKPNFTRTKGGQASRAGQDPRRTVLAQHHRAGRLSEWRGTAIGRLLEDDRDLTRGVSKKALYEAANRFAQCYADWQAAMASRRPMSVTSGGSNAPEDIDRARNAIERYERVGTVLQRQGHAIRQATHDLVCGHHEESWTPPFHMAYHAIQGLKAIADHYGLDWQSEDRRVA